MMTFLTVLDVVLYISLVLFTGWNWFMAMYGSTTIEFWKNKGLGKERGDAQLKFDTWSDNLYRVFGTHQPFRILSPSFRNVPFTGLEWSFKYHDEGIFTDGFPYGS